MDWTLISWLAAAGAGVAALIERILTLRHPDDTGERAAVILMVEMDLALLAIATFLFPFITSLRAGVVPQEPPVGGLTATSTAMLFLLYALERYREVEREEKTPIR